MKKFMAVLASVLVLVCMTVGLVGCGSSNSTKVKLIKIDLTQEQYAFAMKGDNTALQTSFNEYLAEIKSNGELDKIMAKYFQNEGDKVGQDYVGDGTDSNATGATGEGKFVVATNCPFEPFEYILEGKIYGVDMEIAAGYAKKHNLQLIIKNIDFDAILPALDAGYADIGMAGMTVSEDRAAYLFSTEYYNASLNIIVAEDNKDFDDCKTAADVENVLSKLSGKKIGCQAGTTAVTYLEGSENDKGEIEGGFKNIECKTYDTAALATNDVINGNIYAVIVDNAPAAAIVNSYNK